MGRGRIDLSRVDLASKARKESSSRLASLGVVVPSGREGSKHSLKQARISIIITIISVLIIRFKSRARFHVTWGLPSMVN